MHNTTESFLPSKNNIYFFLWNLMNQWIKWDWGGEYITFEFNLPMFHSVFLCKTVEKNSKLHLEQLLFPMRWGINIMFHYYKRSSQISIGTGPVFVCSFLPSSLSLFMISRKFLLELKRKHKQNQKNSGQTIYNQQIPREWRKEGVKTMQVESLLWGSSTWLQRPHGGGWGFRKEKGSPKYQEKCS